eukprot:scaffold14.g1233.t1
MEPSSAQPAQPPAEAPAGAEPPPPPPTRHPLPFRLLATQPTDWDPAAAAVTLCARLDGCIVPSAAAPEGARVSYSHLVVIDDFVPDSVRQQLLDFLTGPLPMDAAQQADAKCDGDSGSEEGGGGGGARLGGFCLPADRWERATADMAGGAATWGVRPHVLAQLAEARLPALREVHARLCKLYPEYEVAYLPSTAIQLAPAAEEEEKEEEQAQGGGAGGGGPRPAKRSRPPAAAEGGGEPARGAGASASASPAVDCAAFVANAAVEGDSFRYHVDADPSSFPDSSPWVEAYGDYCNGEPGRPLLASLMLYLNPAWERDWGAEMLFLDAGSDAGVHVRPRPCRAVLFDQDVLHRVSAPSAAAGGRPRFSLVWKLALLPRDRAAAPCITRPEWGPPAPVGSAARVGAVMRQIAAEGRRRQR